MQARKSKILDDAQLRQMLKSSKEEQTIRSNLRVESRQLERELKLLEKDRHRAEHVINKTKRQLGAELEERRKDVRDVRFDNRMKRSGKFGGIRPPATALVNRRLSLPLQLIPIGVEYANDYEENGPDWRNIDDMSDCSGGSDDKDRGNYHMHMPEYEMTPDDVKLRFKRRFSVNYIDNGLASEEKEQRMLNPDYCRAPQARSRLMMRRQSLPGDLSRGLSRSKNDSMQSIREDTPIRDARFENLMSSLSEKLDSSKLQTAENSTLHTRTIKPTPERMSRGQTVL